MFQRKVVLTADGSATLYVPELGEHYHSVHGAMQESKHVFIDAGLHYIAKKKSTIHILETGLGTGLNAFLTLLEAERLGVDVHYFSVEKYPLDLHEYSVLQYTDNATKQDQFLSLHTDEWEKWQYFGRHFKFYKSVQNIKDIRPPEGFSFDLIYFDAFAPDVQSDLWDVPVFDRLHQLSSKDAVLLTYCSKGQVRRNMKAGGWRIEKLPGPPGKREMVRAYAC
jgi:tRNA U34 5-methylaminomethyl-2-thiouridine-forming methyltransferase MnmC